MAAELSISEDEATSRLGLGQLRALAASNLNDKDVRAFVEAALDAVVMDGVGEIEETGVADESVAAARIAGIDGGAVRTLNGEPPLPSEDDTDKGTGDHG